jgi:hypothetical protein
MIADELRRQADVFTDLAKRPSLAEPWKSFSTGLKSLARASQSRLANSVSA